MLHDQGEGREFLLFSVCILVLNLFFILSVFGARTLGRQEGRRLGRQGRINTSGRQQVANRATSGERTAEKEMALIRVVCQNTVANVNVVVVDARLERIKRNDGGA